MTSCHENYFQSILGSVSYCVIILRTPPFGRLEWRHVILNLAGKSFHCRSRTASGMTCKLVLLSSTSHDQEISTCKNLARVAAEGQNGPNLWEFAVERGSDSTKIPH